MREVVLRGVEFLDMGCILLVRVLFFGTMGKIFDVFCFFGNDISEQGGKKNMDLFKVFAT